ncbi:hypothetical protein ScPMuIL_009731 [Solemya velum]
MASRVVFYCGLAFSAIGLITIGIGVATPNWLEAEAKAGTGFDKLGLWEACFTRFTYRYDSTATIFDGCWGILSRTYSSIRYWLAPAWFVNVQVLATLSMLGQVAVVICLVMIFVGCWSCFSNRPDIEVISWFVISTVELLTGILAGSGCIMFATNSSSDHQWLEKPYTNYRSWSFGLVCVSSVAALIAGGLIFIEAVRIRIRQKKSKTLRRGYEMRPSRRY